MKARTEFSLAIGGLAVGGGLALLFSAQTWTTVSVVRDAPLTDLAVHVSGRKVDATPAALALVALAGIVAVLVTRGVWRRVIGALLVLDGAALIWSAAIASLSARRVGEIVDEKLPSVGSGLTMYSISGSSRLGPWPALTLACGVLILLAGVLIAWRGGGWAGMSMRYARPAPDDPKPVDPEAIEAAEQKANLAMWNALERGDDPTQDG